MTPYEQALERELAAAVAHHEHTMDIIEKALGDDKRIHEGVPLAESIALDIQRLRISAPDMQKQYADALTLLGWVIDCWPKRDEEYYRADMEDCVDAIRSFLSCKE